MLNAGASIAYFCSIYAAVLQCSVLVMSDNKKPMDKLLIATTDNFVMKYLTSFYQWKIVFLSCKVKIILIC